MHLYFIIMQYEGSKEVSATNKLYFEDLDTALKELGMLATSTNSREQYMREISANPCTSSLKINPKYISNVMIACGKCKSSKTNSRFTPYISRARNRTKSENNDSESGILHKMLNDSISCVEDLNQLKKAKSLESIIAESTEQVNFNGIKFENAQELEIVSKCIQNLKFVE